MLRSNHCMIGDQSVVMLLISNEDNPPI